MHRLVVVFVAVLMLPGLAAASSLPPELAAALNRFTGARGFSCNFEQTIRFSDGSRQVYRGALAVLPPGRFRWRYSEPYEQLFVSDGKQIWHYEPDLMQVNVFKRMQGVDPAIMQLLDGSLNLRDVALIGSGTGTDAGAGEGVHRYYVRIGAKTKVWLGIARRHLAYVESMDALGNRNRISLLHMNPRSPSRALFTFQAPSGVDVVTAGKN